MLLWNCLSTYVIVSNAEFRSCVPAALWLSDFVYFIMMKRSVSTMTWKFCRICYRHASFIYKSSSFVGTMFYRRVLMFFCCAMS